MQLLLLNPLPLLLNLKFISPSRDRDHLTSQANPTYCEVYRTVTWPSSPPLLSISLIYNSIGSRKIPSSCIYIGTKIFPYPLNIILLGLGEIFSSSPLMLLRHKKNSPTPDPIHSEIRESVSSRPSSSYTSIRMYRSFIYRQ